MDGEFNRRTSKKAGGIVALSFGILLLIIGVIWYTIGGKNRMVSPLPATPSYEIVFYTPTPPEASITASVSTPSATPKGQKPSATPKPSSSPTSTLTPKPSVTKSVSPTP